MSRVINADELVSFIKKVRKSYHSDTVLIMINDYINSHSYVEEITVEEVIKNNITKDYANKSFSDYKTTE